MSKETKIENLKNGWKRKIFANHDNNVLKYSYLYKGKHKAIRINLKTRKSEHVKSYVLHHKDLRDAKVWLEEANNLRKDEHKFVSLNGTPINFIVTKALLKAAFVNYQKVFGSSEGRQTRLNKSQLPKKLHEKHEVFSNARHQYAAHGGSSELEDCEAILAVPPKNKLRKNEYIIPHYETNLKQVSWMNVDGLHELIDAALKVIDEKLLRLEEQIIEEIFSIPPANLYKFVGRKFSIDLTEENLQELKN